MTLHVKESTHEPREDTSSDDDTVVKTFDRAMTVPLTYKLNVCFPTSPKPSTARGKVYKRCSFKNRQNERPHYKTISTYVALPLGKLNFSARTSTAHPPTCCCFCPRPFEPWTNYWRLYALLRSSGDTQCVGHLACLTG